MSEAKQPSSRASIGLDPTGDYTILGDNVHLWRIDLSSKAHDLSAMRRLLSADEITRADRFLRAEHGERFTLGRGALRSILAAYTGAEAASLRFDYNNFGKPSLATKLGDASITFNLSNTGAQAVVALSHHAALGVDIEAYRPSLELEKLAQRYFAPVEVEALMALPKSRREEAFYRCWSSKEAFMKVCGQGLSIGLSRFTVEVDPDRPPAILSTPDSLPSKETWASTCLVMDPGFSGVLMVEGRLGEVQYRQFSSAP